MSGPYRRSKTHKGRKELYKKYRLRRRTKDLDQIAEELLKKTQGNIAERVTKFKDGYDEELPADGQFKCIPCSRYFISTEILQAHLKDKSHKKRLRQLKERPYTLEEANAAGGCGSNDFYINFK